MSSSGKFDAQQVLATAIALENEGRTNYLEAARAVTDEGVRSIFERLANQEEAHRRYLEHVRDLFGKARGWPREVDVPQDLLETARQNLFPDVEAANPQSYASAADAIRRGIRLEVDSIALYKGVAASATDQVARNIFNDLAFWEGEHLFILNYWLGRVAR